MDIPFKADSVSLSIESQNLLKAEELLIALFLALSDDKEKEDSLAAKLAIGAILLQSIAHNSPFINIEVIDGERVYSISGADQVQINLSNGNFSALVSGGAPMVAAGFSV